MNNRANIPVRRRTRTASSSEGWPGALGSYFDPGSLDFSLLLDFSWRVADRLTALEEGAAPFVLFKGCGF